MECLFDPDKPHFELWRTLYDIDTKPHDKETFYVFAKFYEAAAPLYYAALCGFHDLVEHLIINYPQDVDVNANGGHYVRPLVAALAGKHFQTADLLRQNGADPHCRGAFNGIPLHSAARFADLEVVQKLIEYDADISAVDVNGYTPLHYASFNADLKACTVVRLLLQNSADVNARSKTRNTPLHYASSSGALGVVRLLLEYGADLRAENKDGETALEVVEKGQKPQRDEIVKLLLKHTVNQSENTS